MLIRESKLLGLEPASKGERSKQKSGLRALVCARSEKRSASREYALFPSADALVSRTSAKAEARRISALLAYLRQALRAQALTRLAFASTSADARCWLHFT